MNCGNNNNTKLIARAKEQEEGIRKAIRRAAYYGMPRTMAKVLIEQEVGYTISITRLNDIYAVAKREVHPGYNPFTNITLDETNV